MYVVIFRAKGLNFDSEYHQVAARMRHLAIEKYGCSEFSSVTEGEEEIAISYWHNEEQIKAWKTDPEHIQAQSRGQSHWYQSYHVQVARIVREYGNNTD